MAVIIWNESLSVKIASIDDQHKKLIELINDFYDNVSKSANDELILKLVKGMKTYTIHHFSTEELYMKRLNYPGYEEHKKEHQNFIDKVNAVEEKLQKGTIVVSFEITSFLKDWIKNHIQNTDKKYTEFFLKNGIS
jgi:hemerythrin-like metal-binding protein